MKRKEMMFFVGLVFSGTLAMSQSIPSQLLSSGGEIFKNTSYQLEWSLGELQTETLTAGNSMMTQGFHQSNYQVSAVEKFSDSPFEITVFPNPATDIINLKIDSKYIKNPGYTLTDVSGSVLQMKTIEGNQQQINLSGLVTGTYFLNVHTEKQVLQIFKIIKN